MFLLDLDDRAAAWHLANALDLWARKCLEASPRVPFPPGLEELRRRAWSRVKSDRERLVDADRLDEEQAKGRLRAAARSAGLGKAEAERVIKDGWILAGVHSIEEQVNGGKRDQPPGAFSAVASASTTYDHDNGFASDPRALLPLPTAVLVHRGHDARHSPVGVGVPIWRDGAIQLEGVFASQSPETRTGDTWTLVRTGRVRSVSVWARCEEFHRGADGRLVKGILIAVDLVRAGADEAATVTNVVRAADMTPAQRQVQRNFDRYLADDTNPTGFDLFARAESLGAASLDVLAPVVAPLLEERASMSAR